MKLIGLPPLLVLVLGGGCASSSGQPAQSEQPTPTAELPIPPDLREQIRRSCGIGRQLYVLDKVSAIGTDVLLENVKDPQSKGLVGYLPFQEGHDDGTPKDSFLVSFFTGETPPRIAYEIRVGPGMKPTFEAFEPPKKCPDSFAAFVRARQMAIAAMPPSGQPVNPVLVPGEANGEKGILVYLLAGTKKPNVAVFGRHFRSLVPLDGTSVSYMMPLSHSVLEIATRGPNGKEVAALMVSHVVTDFPLETHVFTSLLVKKPVFVGTRRGVWRVDGDKISFLTDKPPQGLE